MSILQPLDYFIEIFFQVGEDSPPKLSPRTNEEESIPPPIPPKKLLQESGV